MKISEISTKPSNATAEPFVLHSQLKFAFMCTLLLLAALVLEPYLRPLNLQTAFLSWKLLLLSGIDAVLKGDLISVSAFTVRIVTECTPLYALLLFTSFVLSQPSDSMQKITGMLVGIAVITAVNTARIALVTVIGARFPNWFEVVHVYLGQVVMLLLVIGLAMLWQRRWKIAGDHLPFLVRAVLIATLLFIPWLMINVQYVALLDSVVSWIHKIFYPAYDLNTPRPFAIYNHTFAVPFFIALMVASRNLKLLQLIAGTLAGVFAIASWHVLFRGSHVIWTAHNVESMGQVLQAIYLTGQYLVPLLAWIIITGVGRRRLPVVCGRVLVSAALLILLPLLSESPAHALDQTVTVLFNGRDSFILRGDNLQRITEAEINISYENREQPAPRITSSGLGAQAKMNIEADSPGVIVIRMKSAKPLSGSGFLANIKLSGKISYLGGYFRGENGSIGTQFVIKNPSDENLEKATSAVKNTSVQPKEVSAVVTESSSSIAATAAIVTAEKNTKSAAVKPNAVVYKPAESVLDRFSKLHATESREALAKLFKIGSATYSQQPRFALSDGLNSVKVTLKRVGTDVDELKQIHITGGSCVSIQPVDNGDWELEIVPGKGAVRTVITSLTSSAMIEYPLLVAPPLELFDGLKAEKYLVEYVGMVNELAAGMR